MGGFTKCVHYPSLTAPLMRYPRASDSRTCSYLLCFFALQVHAHRVPAPEEPEPAVARWRHRQVRQPARPPGLLSSVYCAVLRVTGSSRASDGVVAMAAWPARALGRAGA